MCADVSTKVTGIVGAPVGTCPALPPPSPPPSPSPSPPDLAIIPNSIVAGVATAISVHTASFKATDTLVFLAAGDATCAGAAFKSVIQGGAVGSLTLSIEMPGLYKCCLSPLAHPTYDNDFSLVSDVTLEVTQLSAEQTTN